MMPRLLLFWVLTFLTTLLTQNAHAQWERCVGADAGIAILADGSNIYAEVGNGDGMFISTDGGDHWNSFQRRGSPTSFAPCGSYLLVGSVAFEDSDRSVYRYFDSSGTWVFRGDGITYSGIETPFTTFALMNDGQDVFAGTSR